MSHAPLSFAPLDDDYMILDDMERRRQSRDDFDEYDEERELEDDGPDPLRLAKKMALT
jgi:hypothetical protein